MMTEPAVDEDDATTYAAHATRLVALATALAGPSAAEDAVSAAVAKVLASPAWPHVRDRGAYLTRAVVNEVHDHHRRAMRRTARERRVAPRATTVDPERDPAPEVIAALAALSVRQRAVVFLTYWADLTPAAIATELGLSEGSVRKHLARARATLRRELA